MLPQAWTDAVTQRVQLHHLGGGVGSLPSKFGAQWDIPRQRQAHMFAIVDGGMVTINAAEEP